ncbi:MAG: ring-hydroxylating oxygenase subunit alpha [Betaproteobacteria bacterium RIFCSPLOWO2_12_FULL_65_14]|nr:MAG: ring-hydroxylating oxygenase subunit alpha [Betaproteobacteria bacterium RIFCSPLOWO2_12_FULL_65_14]
MISAEQNELMTRIGRGTPAGELLRNYWQPVALVDELQGPRPVKAVRVLGEDLVLFRQENAYGLLERHCPHRGADLAYGRLEDRGLRCSFHGWLFDTSGKCLATPAEPEGSRLHEHIRSRAYPVTQKSGILFAYLGAGEPPAFPHFDCFIAPEEYTFAFKGYWDCNWLQALEVGIDPAHASWLHKFFEDEDPAAGYGRQFRATSANSELPMSKVLREHDRPEIRVERTAYGMRLHTLRKVSDARTHLRVTNILFPQAFVIPMSPEMTISQWHVPADDYGCYWYSIFTSFGAPVDKETMRNQRLKTYPAPDYRPIFHRGNGWGFDPEEQRSRTFTGMGFDINIHDQWACESQGRIQDRTREHLGTTDKGIVLYRRILLDAIRKNQAGEKPLMVLDRAAAAELKGPPAVDGIGPADRLDDYWKEFDANRRQRSAWAS